MSRDAERLTREIADRIQRAKAEIVRRIRPTDATYDRYDAASGRHFVRTSDGRQGRADVMATNAGLSSGQPVNYTPQNRTLDATPRRRQPQPQPAPVAVGGDKVRSAALWVVGLGRPWIEGEFADCQIIITRNDRPPVAVPNSLLVNSISDKTPGQTLALYSNAAGSGSTSATLLTWDDDGNLRLDVLIVEYKRDLQPVYPGNDPSQPPIRFIPVINNGESTWRLHPRHFIVRDNGTLEQQERSGSWRGFVIENRATLPNGNTFVGNEDLYEDRGLTTGADQRTRYEYTPLNRSLKLYTEKLENEFGAISSIAEVLEYQMPAPFTIEGLRSFLPNEVSVPGGGVQPLFSSQIREGGLTEYSLIFSAVSLLFERTDKTTAFKFAVLPDTYLARYTRSIPLPRPFALDPIAALNIYQEIGTPLAPKFVGDENNLTAGLFPRSTATVVYPE